MGDTPSWRESRRTVGRRVPTANVPFVISRPIEPAMRRAARPSSTPMAASIIWAMSGSWSLVFIGGHRGVVMATGLRMYGDNRTIVQ